VRTELKRPWPTVWTGSAFSCGGSQLWFPDKNFRYCGCGVIACADTLLYLRGAGELSMEEYLRYVNSLRRYFPLIPRLGIDGLRLSMGLNSHLRGSGLRFRAEWCMSGQRFWDRVERMLADDLPVIVSIGPSFPCVWSRERLPLYRKTENGYAEAARTKAHFLTVIALDETWMRVSSWGMEFYIERRAYGEYMRRKGALFTNLLFLKRS